MGSTPFFEKKRDRYHFYRWVVTEDDILISKANKVIDSSSVPIVFSCHQVKNAITSKSSAGRRVVKLCRRMPISMSLYAYSPQDGHQSSAALFVSLCCELPSARMM